MTLLVIAAAFLSYAEQPCPAEPVQNTFRNLDFTQGHPGDTPPGWQPSGAACSRAVIVDGTACQVGLQCAVLRATESGHNVLYQDVDALPWRGKTLTFRASVRVEAPAGADARLLVRVHRADNSTAFFDDMGRFRVRSKDWGVYQIQAPIADDARDIEFGLQLNGEAAAWIDGISTTFTDTRPHPDESAVRQFMRKFADTRNSHDGSAVAALYSEDGEWLGGGRAHGRAALTELWTRVAASPVTAERTIQSLEFPGPNLAVVRNIVTYSNDSGRHHETMILVKEDGAWKIRVHQTLD
jgi:uncharacterized protein (TIGR02246 family)